MFFHVFLEWSQTGFSMASGGSGRLRKRNKNAALAAHPFPRFNIVVLILRIKDFNLMQVEIRLLKEFEMVQDMTER